MTPFHGGRHGPTHRWRERSRRQAWWRHGNQESQARPQPFVVDDAVPTERDELESQAAERDAGRLNINPSITQQRSICLMIHRLLYYGVLRPPQPPAPPLPISVLLLCNPAEA